MTSVGRALEAQRTDERSAVASGGRQVLVETAAGSVAETLCVNGLHFPGVHLCLVTQMHMWRPCSRSVRIQVARIPFAS